ncbi:hypothetical protein RRG08_034674 [Elysia crispata]|uniref:Uncharacterized protein n=1 Tax=Elysia crispata TaxID=231223 RepID=A0AAE1D839_9GAST|nr:hypothetical protein RRG08_034674 [Elysia crispata]
MSTHHAVELTVGNPTRGNNGTTIKFLGVLPPILSVRHCYELQETKLGQNKSQHQETLSADSGPAVSGGFGQVKIADQCYGQD